MRLLADFHTHSKNSRFFHGKNSIEEMAIAANEIGLEEIAITDHGFKHIFRTSKEKIRKARQIVDEINEWSKTKVLLGVEADIISEDGTIDIDNETIEMLDILLVGYHKMIKTDFASYFGKQVPGKVGIDRCTNAFLNAIEKYPITALTHLDSILTTDLYKIGCACREKGVFVEINNRHTSWTQKQVDDLIDSGCMFIVSSDAHCREDVGEVDHAFSIIKKYNIPSELMVNVEFKEEEKSELGKEIDAYYDLYKEKLFKKQEKVKKVEEKQEKEFSDKLSPEMEEALKKIAHEKGLSYNGSNENEDDNEDISFEAFYNQNEERMIREANENISNRQLSEFDSQNEKLGSLDKISSEAMPQEYAQNNDEMVEDTPKHTDNFSLASRLESIAGADTDKAVELIDSANQSEHEAEEKVAFETNANVKPQTDLATSEDHNFGGGLLSSIENATKVPEKNNEKLSQNSAENIEKINSQSFTSNNSAKSGFGLNISALERGVEINKTSENQNKTTKKTRKNDIASFVQFALDDGDVKKVENRVQKQDEPEKRNANGVEINKKKPSVEINRSPKPSQKRVVGFDPLGALEKDLTKNDDNKK